MYTAKLSTVHEGRKTGITSATLLTACKSTRPSISPADRARFLAIYADFRGVSETSGNEASGAKKTIDKGDDNVHELLGKLGAFGYDPSVKRLATA